VDSINNYPDVVVGTVINRKTAYILGRFLSNQSEIQKAYPYCVLLMATVEPDFALELKEKIIQCNLRGDIIKYDIIKPKYAKARERNITRGREVIRNYMVSKTKAEFLLFIDSDMTVDPRVIPILKGEIKGYDVIHSIYKLRYGGTNGTGLGCSLIKRDALIDNEFQCLEFKNGQIILGEDIFETHLFEQKRRVKRGYFLKITHYVNEKKGYTVIPKSLNPVKKITNLLLVRYLLIKMSILVHFDIPKALQRILAGKRYSFLKR
jgi:hypothetical protein